MRLAQRHGPAKLARIAVRAAGRDPRADTSLVGIRSPELPVNAGRVPAASTEDHMKELIQKFLKDESGASLIEYVLIGGIISIVGIATMVLIGGDVGTIWTNIRAGTLTGSTAP